MSLAPIFIVVLPILTIVAVAAVGSTRKLGFWLTLIASVFLTPIGGYILAVLSGAKQRKPKRRKRRRWFRSASHGEDSVSVEPGPGAGPVPGPSPAAEGVGDAS